ncbi:MAG: PAS domain S-box protein [Gemmatimonadetes bacterium]|nr:PAS domain S-box protein [Gemmatimonadota bacterium]MBK9693318.1 PAS domain S-box protein [Gemmatimonadota bacterium]
MAPDHVPELELPAPALGSAVVCDSLVLRGIRDAVVMTDLAGIVTYWNDGATRLFGWSAAEMLGRPYADRYPEPRRSWVAAEMVSRTAGTEWNGEFEDVRKDGSVVWIEARVRRILDGHGTPVGVLGLSYNITDRKRAEFEARTREEFERAVLDSMSSQVAVLAWDGTIRTVNRSWREFGIANAAPGRPPAVAGVGLNYLEVCRSSQAEDAAAGIVSVLSGARGRFELEYPCHSPAERRWFSMRVTPLGPATGGAVVAHVDITRRKLAEAMLVAQNRVLARIATGDDLTGVLEGVVAMVEEQLPGSLCAVMVREPGREVLRSGAGPSLPAAYNAAVDGVPIGPSVGSCGTAAYRREPVLVTDIATDPLWAAFRDVALPHGLCSCFSMPILAGDATGAASATGELLGTFALYRRVAGAPEPGSAEVLQVAAQLAGVAIQRDRVMSELRASEERLRQAHKMEAIGQLAGGVAHDFNNLLTVINGYAEILRAQLATDSEAGESVHAILEAGQRAAALTGQLLAFSRKAMVQPRLVDLNEVVDAAARMLRRLIGEQVTFVSRLQPGLPPVRIDPGQIEQVVLNLAVNARDAMPDGGTLVVETSELLVPAMITTETGEFRAGHTVQLTVSDTGHGMSEEVRARVFEPFFTTKGVGKGTGLGLATVYGIIRQAGGHVEVSSAPGHGTSFRVLLPVAAAAGQAAAEPPAPERPGTETVLLVEDEAAVRRLALVALERRGYRVLPAASAAEAMALATGHQGRLDLLLTDVVMPDMGGRQLAEALKARRPGLKVLFMSGYTDDTVLRDGLASPDQLFLQKPFSVAALGRRVREVLDL